MATDLFQLKGSLFTLTVLQLQQIDKDGFTQQLDRLVRQAPNFFQYTPVVIDLQAVQSTKSPIDFDWIITQLRHRNMIPVGVRNGNSQQQQAARSAQLAIFNATKSNASSSELPNVSSSAPTLKPTLMIHKPIRSGQQVYAQGGDLIVTAAVSPGAELLADGNIHVYGPLRGRALAGIQGDAQARIFCQSLAAELISIAGSYMLMPHESTQQTNYHRPHQVYLETDKLIISPLAD